MRHFPPRSLALASVALATWACGEKPTATAETEAINVSIVSGDGQTHVAGTELPEPLVVRVTNRWGLPLPRQHVNFRVTTGDGSMYAGAALTNLRGIEQDYWTLGPDPGENAAEVRTVNAYTGEKQVYASFSATGVPLVASVDVEPPSAALSRLMSVLR